MPFFFSAPRSIGGRLAAVVTGTLALAVVGSGIGLRSLSHVAQETDHIVSRSVVTERLVSDWYRNTAVAVRRTTAIAVSSDPSLADYFAKEIEASTKFTSELQTKVEPLLDKPEEKEIYARIGEVRKEYLKVRNAIAADKLAGKVDEARTALDAQFVPISDRYLKELATLMNFQRAKIDSSASNVAAMNQKAQWTLMVFTAASTLLGAVLGVLLVNSITRPLKAAASAAVRIGRLDLTEAIQVRGAHETVTLLTALQNMQGALRLLVKDVRSSTESISTASSQIAAGNADLSQRTEEAASNLQQTAASMEQMSGVVQSSAANARTAVELAVSAAQVAEHGGDVVAQVVSTMLEIENSSRRISDIIGVVDGIAFQTNILALNAAVEAARAGEQGRGFAVVAGEVRTLAQRSAEASKEIKQLIGASVGNVQTGSKLVADAGRTMTDIVTCVKRVSDIIGELSHAANEQGHGIGQVNSAVAQLDQVTQQNAALVEESAAAAESLSHQATNLAKTVQRFVV